MQEMRITGGFLLSMRYAKAALSLEAQLALLQARGLAVNDRDRALHWLGKVSYFRLSAYCLPFKEGERFSESVEFDAVAGLYIFDRKLRLVVLDAIERIEVAIRTALVNELAAELGVFGHVDATHFAPDFDHAGFLSELAVEERRSHEVFVSHYRRKYTSERDLPIWMAAELMSFGTMSRLYRASRPRTRQRIAAMFGVDAQFLASWLHVLSYVRNVCAHHKRLWNREFAIKPRFPSRSLAWPHSVPDNGRLYAALVVIQHCLRVVAPRCRWRDRLFAQFDAHPGISLDPMRIPDDWRQRALWRERA